MIKQFKSVVIILSQKGQQNYFLCIQMGKQQLLYKYPPDISKAQKHRLSNRIFKGVQKDPACQQCQCCDRKIGVEIVDSSCCYSKNQLAFLGPGIPLLFAYIRNAILLLFSFTLVFSGFTFYSNFSSSYCSINSTDCAYNIFNTISLANKLNNSDLLSIQNYILLAFVTLNIFLFQFFRYNFRKIQQECDDIVNSPSDYAVILRRLPQNITKQDIQKMIQDRRLQLTEQQKQKTQNLKIDHIVMSFYMGEYTRIKQTNLQNFKKYIDDQKHTQFKPQPLPKLTQSAKLAIIVFTRQQSKDLFIYKPSITQKLLQMLCDPCTPLSHFIVKGQRVSIQRAPQPDDVVWQNSKISIGGAITRKSIFNILGVLVLLLGGVAQFWLNKVQQTVTDATMKQLYSIGLSIIITIFNFIILQFLIFSSHKQRNQTLTEFNTVLTVKISFFQFLNTGIFVVLINFLVDTQNFTITQTLPTDITIVMLTNAITPNLSLWLMNYFQITGKIFRWLVKSQKMKVTQLQANQIWQGPPAQVPYKYSYILKTIWLTAFYAPLVPIVVPISMVGLGINYFIQKHLYRFVYSVPNMLSSMVNDSAIQLMEYFPLIMSLGEFIIYIYMKHYDVVALPINWSIPIYISIALGFLNLILPMDQLNKCIKLKNNDLVCPPYQKVQQKFQVTYQMTNPAYECKKKRKRDVYLFNHVFGGQGQNAALNLSSFIGLPQTDRSMVKDPLLNKNNQGENNIFLAGLIGQNDQVPKQNEKNDITIPSNKVSAEQQNPFGAFMKLNANKQSSNKQNINPTGKQIINIRNQNNNISQNTGQINNKNANSLNGLSNVNMIKKQNQNRNVEMNNNMKNSNAIIAQLFDNSNNNNSIHVNNKDVNNKNIVIGGQNINNINSSDSNALNNTGTNIKKDNNVSSNIVLNNNNIVQNSQNSNKQINPLNNNNKQQQILIMNNNNNMLSNNNIQSNNNTFQNNNNNKLMDDNRVKNEYKNMTKDLQYKYNNNNSNNNNKILTSNDSKININQNNNQLHNLNNQSNQVNTNIQSNNNINLNHQINSNNQNNLNNQINQTNDTQQINRQKTNINKINSNQSNIQSNHHNTQSIHHNHDQSINQSHNQQINNQINNQNKLNNNNSKPNLNFLNKPKQQSIPKNITQALQKNNSYDNTPLLMKIKNIKNQMTRKHNIMDQDISNNQSNQNKPTNIFVNNYVNSKEKAYLQQFQKINNTDKKNKQIFIHQQPSNPYKNKSNQVSQDNLKFLNDFPNLDGQKQIGRKAKAKFIQDSQTDISYLQKKSTKKGTMFYQSPQNTPKSTFPHVQIYVPGLNAQLKGPQQLKSSLQRKRSFGKSKQKDRHQSSSKKLQNPTKLQGQQYTQSQIYNPRFGQKQVVDINKFYGPPDIFGIKNVNNGG